MLFRSCDLQAKVAYAHAALAGCARIQQSDLNECELALCKRLRVFQDDRNGFVRVEHAEGEIGRRWLIEVTVVVGDAQACRLQVEMKVDERR